MSGGPLRRAGAPRLIEWTGERCVPWAPDVQVVYEHFHRYLWARELVAGKRVLDVGSGEGFGSAILSERAESVLGVDIDQKTVDHARLNYVRSHLRYEVASATDLSLVEDDSIDVVVSFEVIEHVTDQAAVMAEIERVLVPDGIVIMSSPDRRAYSDATGQVNPYHEHELTLEEFDDLLSASFPSVQLFVQRVVTGSRIEALNADSGEEGTFAIERAGDEWQEGGSPSPLYVLGVAARGAVPAMKSGSTLVDFEIQLVRAAEEAVHRERNAAGSDPADILERAETAHRERESDLRRQLLRAGADRESAIAEGEAFRRDTAAGLAEVKRMRESVMWRLLQKVTGKTYAVLGGKGSRRGRAISRALLLLARAAPSAARPSIGGATAPPIVFPEFDKPDVSIVIPCHSGAPLTERCLHAIIASAEEATFEVVLVDDASDDATKALLGVVEGVQIVRNATNRGFLESTNAGARAARGRHILLLNNDTEPQPGWLDVMLRRLQSEPDVGIVAPKLVYPNGVLQEAGGIVWRDGNAANYGKGRDASAPEFNFVREIDYGSGAALLVDGDLWRQLGGFDERFAPGYWEDTDLCFAARAAGLRVLYDPAATVIHAEGGSMGTDVESGGKRFQVVNQPKFMEKWADALALQPRPPHGPNHYPSANHRSGPVAVVVDHRVPTPDRDAGSLRMRHLIEGLIRLGSRVVFVADDLNPAEPYTTALRERGVEVVVGNVSFREEFSRFGPQSELVLLSRPYVAGRHLALVRELAPGATLIYDTVDLHFVRETRRDEQEGTARASLTNSYRELELGVARASDVTFVVSEEERRQLTELEPQLDVRVVPVAHDIGEHDVNGWDQRAGLLFVGGFEHTPNVDAVEYLVNEVMPLVWAEIGDAHLTVVGPNAPPHIEELAGPNVEIAGWVEDLDPLLDTSLVAVAPVRYGAGLKGKVTQSLAHGLPVVTTTVGAEGTDGVNGEQLFIGDDAAAFAAGIIALHQDPTRWAAFSQQGRELARRMVSPKQQEAVLTTLLGGEHRNGSSS